MKRKGGGAPWVTSLAVALAILSSVGSIAVAVVGGWQRGGTMPTDQVLFAGLNVLGALSAQFLPVIAARLASVKRVTCVGIWLVCIACTALAHAWYLLAAQERAGTTRAEALRLTQASKAPASRERLAILNDRAGIGEQLARLPVRACDNACADRQRFHKAALEDRLAALDAEAQAEADARQSRLQQEEQQRRAKEDLVGNRLAASLGLSYSTVTWCMALAYAIILEGVGCLCWTVAFEPEPNALDDPSVTTNEAGVTAVAETETMVLPSVTSVTQDGLSDNLDVTPASAMKEYRDLADDSPRVTPGRARQLDQDVVRVIKAVRDSEIRLTVTQVQEFLRCGRKYASQIRKVIGDTSGDPPMEGA